MSKQNKVIRNKATECDTRESSVMSNGRNKFVEMRICPVTAGRVNEIKMTCLEPEVVVRDLCRSSRSTERCLPAEQRTVTMPG
jgi:hypothetical protein